MTSSVQMSTHGRPPTINAGDIRSLDEAMLLEELQKSPQGFALDELIRRHSQAAFNIAFFITRNRELAEESVQFTFCTLWKSANSLTPGETRGWILKTCLYRAKNLVRSRYRMRKRVSDAAALNVFKKCNEPDLLPERTELHAALAVVLKDLCTDDRELIALRFSANLSQRQISQRLGVPQTTISGRLDRIVKKLREHLHDAGFAALVVGLEAGLQDAMCGSYALPVGMEERLIKASRKPAPYGVNALAMTSIILVLGVSAYAGVVLMNTESTPEKESLKPRQAPVVATEKGLNILLNEDFDGNSLSSEWIRYDHGLQARSAFTIRMEDSVALLRVEGPKTKDPKAFVEVGISSSSFKLREGHSGDLLFTYGGAKGAGRFAYGASLVKNQDEFLYYQRYDVRTLDKKKGFLVESRYANERGQFPTTWSNAKHYNRLRESSLILSFNAIETQKPMNTKDAKFDLENTKGKREFIATYDAEFKRLRICFFIRAYANSWVELPVDRCVVVGYSKEVERAQVDAVLKE